MQRVQKLQRGTLYLLLAILCLVAAFPLYWMAITAFKSDLEILAHPARLLPHEPTSAHFRTLVEVTRFGTYFFNSILISAAATGLSIIVSVLCAYSLARWELRGFRLFTRWILYSYMFPRILLVIPLFMLVVWAQGALRTALPALGLTDNRLVLVLAYLSFTVPFSVWLLRSFMLQIPLELEDAALVDGASRLRTFIYIILPQAVPGIIATSLFTFIASWNEYLYPLIFIHSDSKQPLPVGVATFFSDEVVYSWGVLMAAATLITAPVLLFFVFVQKYLTEGWGVGAVKG